MNKVYIAGGFFNEEQLQAIKDIEEECEAYGINYFSPRLEGGVLKDMTKHERAVASSFVYDMNVRGIKESSTVIAVIDDYDPGTMVEIGMAAILKKTIITISNKGYGLNVMLATPVRNHTRNAENAIAAYLGRPFEDLKIEVVT